MIRSLLRHPPDAPVAVGGSGARRARDLLAASAAVARFLATLPDGQVLVICDDRYHLAAALLGSWRAGRSVLLPPNGQPATVRALAHAPGVVTFLHDRPGAEEGIAIDPILAETAAPEPLPGIPASRLLATLATSGSTGTHQLCPKTATQILGEARDHVRNFGVPPGACVVSTVPAHHIYGLLYGVLVPLWAGGAFVRETPLQPDAVLAALQRHGATHLVSVPAHLRALAGVERAPALARVFSSGAALSPEVSRSVSTLVAVPITEVYGSSETGGVAWRNGPDGPWIPFPGVSTSADAHGQLLVESPYLAPDAPRPFPCGDRVALRVGGGFDLLGRVDGVAKVAGKRVALAELEARCLALPGVRDAAALTVRVDGARGEEIRLAVVAPGWDPERIRSALVAWFDPATLPRRIRVVPALPREESGKLTRNRLASIFERPPPVAFALGEEHTSHDGDAEVRTVDASVPLDLSWFRGHFDGHPVLPGIVQLGVLVLPQARRAWPDLGGLRRVLRLKFRSMIVPGARLTLRLRRRTKEAQVAFEIDRDTRPCASGTLVFGRMGRTS